MAADVKPNNILSLFITAAHVVDKKCWFETALLWAALGGYRDIVNLLLADYAYINTGDSTLDRLKIIELLINKGADIHAKGIYSKDALMCAACNGIKEVVELLLDKGANIHARDDNGRTPLMWAATNANEHIVALLLERGAAINDKNIHDSTALSIASSYKPWEQYNGTMELLELCSQD